MEAYKVLAHRVIICCQVLLLSVISTSLSANNQPHQVPQEVDVDDIIIIQFTAKGDVWTATKGKGCSMFDATTCSWTNYNSDNTRILPSDSVTAINTCTINGVSCVFIGTTKGLVYLRNNNTWAAVPGLINSRVTGITLSPDSNLLVSTPAGVSVFSVANPTAVKHLTDLTSANTGLPFDNVSALQNKNVNCNGIFAASADSGYFTIDSAYGGAHPGWGLVNATNGLLYGQASEGGATNDGIIFSYDTATGIFTNLFNFNKATSGAHPNGNLIQATDGLLYGLTTLGGAHNAGVIFSFNTSNNTFTKLVDFDSSTGASPLGGLLQANDGLLYGLTQGGGLNGYGVIFSYNTLTPQYTKLFDFDITTGAIPTGALIQAGNGRLYGVTQNGGLYSRGVIFAYTIGTAAASLQVNFDSVNGWGPLAGLMEANNGLLYGMTYLGGTSNLGVLYSFNPSDSSLTKLIDFDGSTFGSNPEGVLAQASNGRLYGLTEGGGAYSTGLLFSYRPDSAIFAQHYDFGGPYGQFPDGSVLPASNGMLYGLTWGGGANQIGTMFAIDTLGNNFHKLYDFNQVVYFNNTTTSSQLVNNSVNYILVSNSCKTVYIATEGGLSIDTSGGYGPASFINLTTANGLPENNVTAVDVDSTNRLWIATRDSGIAVYNGTSFHYLNHNSGLPSNLINSINCNASCNCWVGTKDSGIVVVDSLFNVQRLSAICIAPNAITDINSPFDVKVFPQPAQSMVQFNFSSIVINGAISLTDVNGKTVFSKVLNNTLSYQANVNQLATGFYLYTIRDENKIPVSGKISIAR